MPTLEEIYLRSGQIISEDWYRIHYELHKSQIYESAIDFYGYIHKDLIPDTDLFYNIGVPEAKIKEIHAGYGYFNVLYKNNRIVLADGDPIYISDIYPEAQEKITYAIDYSKILYNIYDYVRYIHSDILDLTGTLKPYLLDAQVNYLAPDFGDIFPYDLVIPYDGRLRVKIIMSNSGYAYIKHNLLGAFGDVIGSLNAGDVIPANAWHEFDFTVSKDDLVNVRVSPSTTVTVILYNIPNT